MSDCSAEVPSEHEEDERKNDEVNDDNVHAAVNFKYSVNAADYQPKKYNESYHKASKLLSREERKHSNYMQQPSANDGSGGQSRKNDND